MILTKEQGDILLDRQKVYNYTHNSPDEKKEKKRKSWLSYILFWRDCACCTKTEKKV